MLRSNACPLALLLLASNAVCAQTNQPAIVTTFEDGNLAATFAEPGVGLPAPLQLTVPGLPSGARPHGAAYITQDQVLVADFRAPARLYRISVGANRLLNEIPVAARANGNGAIAVSPDANYAIFAGEIVGTGGAASVPDAAVLQAPFDGTGRQTSLSLPGRVRTFNTRAVAFAPDGRAYICHTTGVSVLDPPYASVSFTLAHDEPNGVGCAMRPDGGRLVVARRAAGAALALYDAPITAASTPLVVPVASGIGIMTPVGFSPDGNALLAGQIFRPVGSSAPNARAFVVRAQATPPGLDWEEITLPTQATGSSCVGASGTPGLCPGFEDLDISADGRLALLTGNSSVAPGDFFGRAPLVAITNPFDAATRASFAVAIGDAGNDTHGRGTGSVRFVEPTLPLMRDGFE
jgi:hypothetical protein